MKKKHHEEHHEEHADETWLIPYADLLTLLLALFIVLFASSNVDKDKMTKMKEAFADAFGAISYFQPLGITSTFIDEAKGLKLDNQVGIGSDSRGINIDITSVKLFEEGSIQFKDGAMVTLQQIADLLKEEKYKHFRIIVEGHTDDKETSSTLFPSNWELSAARAAAVANVFTKMGINPNSLQAVGMAGIAPAYPNLDIYGTPIPINREKNRRIVIRLDLY